MPTEIRSVELFAEIEAYNRGLGRLDPTGFLSLWALLANTWSAIPFESSDFGQTRLLYHDVDFEAQVTDSLSQRLQEAWALGYRDEVEVTGQGVSKTSVARSYRLAVELAGVLARRDSPILGTGLDVAAAAVQRFGRTRDEAMFLDAAQDLCIGLRRHALADVGAVIFGFATLGVVPTGAPETAKFIENDGLIWPHFGGVALGRVPVVVATRR